MGIAFWMDLIQTFFFVIFWITQFFLFRSSFVLRFTIDVSLYAKLCSLEHAEKKQYDKGSLFLRVGTALPSHRYMVLHFWVWPLHKFLDDIKLPKNTHHINERNAEWKNCTCLKK